MAEIERVLTVDKPATLVWDYLSDFCSTDDWDPGTVETVRTSGDGGPGTTYGNTSRFLGRETRLTYTVTEVRPGRQIVLRGENGTVTSTDTITVDAAAGGGTRVSYRAALSLHGLARMAEPLVGLGLRKLGADAEQSLAEALQRL